MICSIFCPFFHAVYIPNSVICIVTRSFDYSNYSDANDVKMNGFVLKLLEWFLFLKLYSDFCIVVEVPLRHSDD